MRLARRQHDAAAARSPERRKQLALRAGLIAILVIAVGSYFGFTKANPFADPFKLSAAFRTANDIKKGAKVRIAGVNVGKVVEIEPVEEGSAAGRRGAGAIVHMEIDDAGLPIHEDATMKIRPRIFLEGNWFVDIKPGSPSAPIVEEGTTIPVQQTAAPVQFGQLLAALQSETRQDLQVVLDEYGRALSNGGARAYNRSLDYWVPAFRGSAIVSEATLGTEEHDLSRYLKGAGRFARGLDRDPEALKALITNLADTAEAFASEESNLTAAIRELPRTLIAGKSALGALNESFPNVRRFVAEMRPAVQAAGPSLDAQLPLVRQLRGLVSKSELRGLLPELEPVVHNLAELNHGGVDLQKELRLLSSCTNEVMTPWRSSTLSDKAFPASGPVFQEQVKWMPGIAAESRNSDANGQYVRSLTDGANYAYPTGDGRFYVSGDALLGVNPPRAKGIPPLRADVPCETQQPPDLRTIPEPPPEARKVNWDAPGVAEASARSRVKALRWLRRDIRQMGHDLKVSDKPLLRSQIPQLDRAVVRK